MFSGKGTVKSMAAIKKRNIFSKYVLCLKISMNGWESSTFMINLYSKFKAQVIKIYHIPFIKTFINKKKLWTFFCYYIYICLQIHKVSWL